MTYRHLLNSITEKLEAANVPDAKTDAWRLFEDFGGMSRSTFFMKSEEEITDTDFVTAMNEKAEMRAKRIPLQFITGIQEFCGLEFEVGKDTLIPRFDTEILCEEVLNICDGKKVLDLCTGTGCILISVAKLAKLSLAVGSDISEGAVELARRNAVKNDVKDVRFFAGDLFEALRDTEYEKTEFDIIVSNPPYITSDEMETLEPEVVKWEPRSALFGGKDGLDFYRRISEDAAKHMAMGGKILFEIGCNQGESVAEILKKAGFSDIKIKKDYAGLDRVISGTKG